MSSLRVIVKSKDGGECAAMCNVYPVLHVCTSDMQAMVLDVNFFEQVTVLR